MPWSKTRIWYADSRPVSHPPRRILFLMNGPSRLQPAPVISNAAEACVTAASDREGVGPVDNSGDERPQELTRRMCFQYLFFASFYECFLLHRRIGEDRPPAFRAHICITQQDFSKILFFESFVDYSRPCTSAIRGCNVIHAHGDIWYCSRGAEGGGLTQGAAWGWAYVMLQYRRSLYNFLSN